MRYYRRHCRRCSYRRRSCLRYRARRRSAGCPHHIHLDTATGATRPTAGTRRRVATRPTAATRPRQCGTRPTAATRRAPAARPTRPAPGGDRGLGKGMTTAAPPDLGMVRRRRWTQKLNTTQTALRGSRGDEADTQDIQGLAPVRVVRRNRINETLSWSQ